MFVHFYGKMKTVIAFNRNLISFLVFINSVVVVGLVVVVVVVVVDL